MLRIAGIYEVILDAILNNSSQLQCLKLLEEILNICNTRYLHNDDTCVQFREIMNDGI